MIQDITITVYSSAAAAAGALTGQELRSSAARRLGCSAGDVTAVVFKKKSLDARHGKVKFHLKYTVYTKPDIPPVPGGREPLPEYRQADPSRRVIIIGSGPAGLFAALRLLENGITPVIVERGSTVSRRKRDIADISRLYRVDPDSNYCFGEGGAGTFSDGKLYTRSHKRGNPARIYRIFNRFGAPDSILTDAHPHIGTDLLPRIVHNMTECICSLGGEVLFNSRCTGFLLESSGEGLSDSAGTGEKNAVQHITGITICNTITGEKRLLSAPAVILAAGHSADDIYEYIAGIAPAALEQKTFAAGVRVEHPRAVIDRIQYHGKDADGKLPAAEYRLTAQVDGRGVYSFCMCPGGLVVPSSSSNDGLVVNGMSPSSRGGRWSNAALVVEIKPEDAAEMLRKAGMPVTPSGFTGCGCRTGDSTHFVPAEVSSGNNPLAGLYFRRWLERLALEQGDGQQAPAQRLTDFLSGNDSRSLPESSYTPGLVPSRLDLWLPEHISTRLRTAVYQFDTRMRGFITEDAVLIAPETRTSTPVRILRDAVSGECPLIRGLYPAGEGSGYAGGIVSSAMDGERVAASVAGIFSRSPAAG